MAKELLSALLSAAAIAAGFMTTALSILLPMGGTDVGHRLHKRGKLPLLFGYLRSATYGCLALSFICVVGLFAFEESAGLGSLMSTLVIGFAVFSAMALARILEILIKVLTAMAVPEDKRDT
jgi:hypothetical protein